MKFINIKKMSKKCLFFLPLLILFLACSPSTGKYHSWVEDSSRLRVLSTTAMIGDLVEEIGKDRVNNLVLIYGELDPHSYELVKGDDEKLNLASVVFYNGMGLEHGASLHHYLTSEKKAYSLGDSIKEKFPGKVLSIDGTLDPHIWMDISLWVHATYLVEDVLSKQDPASAAYYHQNAADLRVRLEKHHEKIKQITQEIPAVKRYVVTSHDAFNYFARAYLATDKERSDGSWHVRFQAPEGLAPEGRLSPYDIQKIMNHVKEFNIQVIFAESNVSKESIRKITSVAAKMNLGVVIASDVLYGDAMGPSISGGKPNYFDMMEHNARNLQEHLQ